MKAYEDPDIGTFALNASIQESVGYERLEGNVTKPVKTRIVETMEFAERMNYKTLGFIFCEGLSGEAATVEKIFSGKGFEMVSVVCKAGRTPKEDIGIKDEDEILPGTFEPMCNPVFQASIVNEAKVDFNIIMGLCVGHDSLVIKHLDAPVTILAAKDRVLGHNPIAAVYNSDSYYAFIK
jgi:uncharacterized metal-binding protein